MCDEFKHRMNIGDNEVIPALNAASWYGGSTVRLRREKTPLQRFPRGSLCNRNFFKVLNLHNAGHHSTQLQTCFTHRESTVFLFTHRPKLGHGSNGFNEHSISIQKGPPNKWTSHLFRHINLLCHHWEPLPDVLGNSGKRFKNRQNLLARCEAVTSATSLFNCSKMCSFLPTTFASDWSQIDVNSGHFLGTSW